MGSGLPVLKIFNFQLARYAVSPVALSLYLALLVVALRRIRILSRLYVLLGAAGFGIRALRGQLSEIRRSKMSSFKTGWPNSSKAVNVPGQNLV
jgi:hypothetical protein